MAHLRWSVLRKKGNHGGVQSQSKTTDILSTNSSAKVPQDVVTKRLNSFPAQTNPAENTILENWSQKCGTKKMHYQLRQSGEKNKTVLVYVEQNVNFSWHY